MVNPAIRVVEAVHRRLKHGRRTRIELVPGHSGIDENDRADHLAGAATSENRKGRTSIEWVKERMLQQFTIENDSQRPDKCL
jgi:hypothetical protein